MFKSIYIFIFLFLANASFSQYDAECFNEKKKEIMASLDNSPLESMHIQDTLTVNNVRRYVDTILAYSNLDINLSAQKLIGCRLPDFNFFNISGTELSINKIESDFAIISFSFATYGDVCNARLYQYGRLKSLLKDSLTVINIFTDTDKIVSDCSLNYESNVEFVANADLLIYQYGLDVEPVIYVIDKYKNIIFVKTGYNYNYSPDGIYSELLEKIRATNCAD